MTINEIKSADNITLQLSGRLDTITSPDLQAAVLTAFKKNNTVILDFNLVDYISSAGLRTLLIGCKTAKSKGGHMYLEEVQDTVMEVLKMTGFTELLELREHRI